MQTANIRQGSAYFGQIVPQIGKIGKGYELGNQVGQSLSFFCPFRERIKQRKNPTNHWICRVLRFFVANCRSFWAEREVSEPIPFYPYLSVRYSSCKIVCYDLVPDF